MDKQLMHDIVQRDIQSCSKAILFWDEKMDWSAVTKCLELGAREGGLSLWLALKGKEVICSDITILNAAKQLHKKYKISNKIEYEEINATGIPYEDYFDVIVFKSILSAIGKDNNFALQKQAVDEMYKALKPGGKLLFAEYLRASLVHEILRNKFQQWGEKWRYLSFKEMNALMKKFSSLDVETTGFLSLFGTSEAQRNTLAAADEKMFNKLVPQDWHYIAFGIAEK